MKQMVKKEEVNDRYSTIANAGDQKKPSEKAKRIIDSMFRRSVKVENAESEQPAKHANQATAKIPATIEPIPVNSKNNDSMDSMDRNESSRTTTVSPADAGTKERSIWESHPEDLDDGCSDVEGDMNETGLPKQRHLKDNTNCEVCGKKFTSSGYLIVHMRTHTGARPFKCPTCKKRFSQIGSLNKHKVVHTGKKPFKCNACKKRFTQSGSLKIHKRIHTGEKPFECDVCEKKFITNGELTIHKRFHTGERPFKCEICNKGFVKSGDLRRHRRIHTGEKPYKCLTCGKCFSQGCNLKTHKRTHEGPDADSQLDAQQDAMDQSSTIAACDPLNNYANGQKIRYKRKSIDFVVKKMTRRNPDVVYLVWSKKFTMEVASVVALSGFNCILCVKKIQPLPFRDVVNLSDGLHTCLVEVGPDSKTLRLFSFGGMILPEKITNHGRFKSLAKFESKMRRFSQSEGKEMVNIFKHSEKNSRWYRSLRDGLKGESIITDYV